MISPIFRSQVNNLFSATKAIIATHVGAMLYNKYSLLHNGNILKLTVASMLYQRAGFSIIYIKYLNILVQTWRNHQTIVNKYQTGSPVKSGIYLTHNERVN